MGKPQSLKSGQTPADRRIIADAVAANGDPSLNTVTQDQIAETGGLRFLHIWIQMQDINTTIQWRLWTRSLITGLWALDTRLGTAGTVDLDSADLEAMPASWNDLEMNGIDQVYVQLLNFGGAGSFTNGVNLWMGSGE